MPTLEIDLEPAKPCLKLIALPSKPTIEAIARGFMLGFPRIYIYLSNDHTLMRQTKALTRDSIDSMKLFTLSPGARRLGFNRPRRQDAVK